MKTLGCSSRTIAAQIKVPKSTVNDIYRHAVQNAIKKSGDNSSSELTTISSEPARPVVPCLTRPIQPGPQPGLALSELLAKDCLDTNPRSGRPVVLTIGQKKILADKEREDFRSRRMRVVDLQQEAGVGHVCRTTAAKALREKGIKAYREDFKFILSTENKFIRKV